ncbi:OmpA family protein [Paraflavisolibacter sp. H34]|uniref:OmpA family protein n=1 Tax=Huijunlia imazamoxiresistens TaxID=3127457 RepID=UPI0030192CAA
MKTIRQFAIILAAVGFLASGCSSMNRSQKGAVIGAAGGGAIGGVIGRSLGNTAMGAIIGAAVGGTTGAVIGRKMDKQAEEMKKVLGDAEVKRVGEGIVVEFKEKILFGFNSADLGANSQNGLTKLTEVLQRYPDTNIEIIGHTDDKGTDAYNQTLSEKRAASVATFLKGKGISSARITTLGKGESDPKVANDTDANRAENRRVEFVITANEKMVQEAKKEAGQ